MGGGAFLISRMHEVMVVWLKSAFNPIFVTMPSTFMAMDSPCCPHNSSHLLKKKGFQYSHRTHRCTHESIVRGVKGVYAKRRDKLGSRPCYSWISILREWFGFGQGGACMSVEERQRQNSNAEGSQSPLVLPWPSSGPLEALDSPWFQPHLSLWGAYDSLSYWLRLCPFYFNHINELLFLLSSLFKSSFLS